MPGPLQVRGRRVCGILLAALVATGCARRAQETPGDPPPLRLALYSAPLSLDPHLRDEFLTFSVLQNVFDGLVAFDHELRIVPALATRWENPNDLTWRFALRPGVRFHDGTACDAEDVVFSLERARRHPRTNVAQYLVAVSEVRALDASTVEVVTSRPYPILLNKLTHVLVVPAETPDEMVHPVGTGPYRVVAPASGVQLELVAAPGAWHPPPPEERVLLLAMPDAAERAARLAAGEVDVALEISAAAAERIQRAPGVRVTTQDSLAVDYLQMSPSAPPFDDRRVRLAVHLALDREGLVERELYGYGRPAGQMLARPVFGYVADLEPQPRDLQRARELLREAGHPSGPRVELHHRVTRSAAGVAEQLAEAGFEVVLRPQPWDELFPRLQAGEVPFYYGAFLAASADASDLFDGKVHTRDEARGYGDTNFARFSDPELDRLIEASGMTLDMQARRQMLEGATRRLAAELVLVPLFEAFQLSGLSEGVEWRRRADGRVLAADLRRR